MTCDFEMQEGQEHGKDGRAKGCPFEDGMGKTARERIQHSINTLRRTHVVGCGNRERDVRGSEVHAQRIEQKGGERDTHDTPHEPSGEMSGN